MKIGIIPARGGSKRLPGKNIKMLEDKPLIAHSIVAARNSDQLDEVWVSTDSDEIAAVSREFGAKILNRPEELSGDYTSTGEVIKYHVENFLRDGVYVSWVCVIQPTNPVRPDNLMKDMFKIVETEDYRSVACFSPMEKKFGRIENKMFIPESYTFGERSQDIQDRFYENGLLYIVRSDLARKGVILSEDVYPFIIDSIHGTVDIDTVKDFEYAQFVMQYIKQKNFE